MSAESVSREDDLVVIPVGAEMPQNCIKCGKPTENPGKSEHYTWYPGRWLFLVLFFLVLGIVLIPPPLLNWFPSIFNSVFYLYMAAILASLIMYRKAKSMKVRCALCDVHSARGAHLLRLGYVLLVLGIGGLCLVITTHRFLARGYILFAAIATLAGSQLVGLKSLRPALIAEDYGKFKGAGPGFLALLRGGKSNE